MKNYLTKIVAHTSECGWLGLAMLLWSAETSFALLMNRKIFIKNLRELPGFFEQLRDSWRDRIAERFDD